MRRVVYGIAAIAALALAVFWLSGGLEPLARWAADGQRSFQNAMATVLRQLRAGEAGALLALLGLAFGYGFFHAVGPGHGKLLIGSYGAASRVRIVPLAAIALASSLAQATTAVLLVYGGVFLFNATRAQMEAASDAWLAPASAAAIGMVGAWLAWRGMRGLWRGNAWRGGGANTQETHPHGHEGGNCPSCGHRHGPSADDMARIGHWRDAVLLVGSIAIRPCTGALFLLILTWRMGIEGAGILGAYAMGLGTASVTVAVAVLAVSAREGAQAWLASAVGQGGVARIVPVVEMAVGLLVVLVAGQMLFA